MEPEGSLPHSQHPATCPYPEMHYCYRHVNVWRWRMTSHFIHSVYFSPYCVLIFNTPRFGTRIDPRLPVLLCFQNRCYCTDWTRTGVWLVHAAHFSNSKIWQCMSHTANSPTLVTVSVTTKERHCPATTLDRFLRNPQLYGLLGSEHERLTACLHQSAVQCPRPAFIIMWTGMRVPCWSSWASSCPRHESRGIALIILQFVANGGEWSASCHGHFIPRGKSSRYSLIITTTTTYCNWVVTRWQYSLQ
jgi:hypothetical protein